MLEVAEMAPKADISERLLPGKAKPLPLTKEIFFEFLAVMGILKDLCRGCLTMMSAGVILGAFTPLGPLCSFSAPAIARLI